LIHRGFIGVGYDGAQNVRDEERRVDQQQQSRWRPTRKQVSWTVGIIAVIVGAYIFLRFAYVREWKWTGLVKNPDYHNRTLWDWLNLLIIPAVLAAGGLWFNQRQQARAEMSETQRAQDEALQAYLDKMSDLLIDNDLHKKEGDYDETRVTARAHTLAVLERLDAKRKRTVLLFLREARLINRYKYCPRGQEQEVTYYPHYVGLGGADLSGAYLEDARLISTSGHEPVSLKEANLKDAVLHCADLRGADLSGADLSGANLNQAKLGQADLPYPELSTANLSGANLSGADLINAEVTKEQLLNAESLKDATMPNGQKYQDWRKDREGRKEDRENPPPQPEASRSKPRRWQTVFSFLRNFARNDDAYSSFSNLLVRVLLPTYVFGIFLVWTVASIGEYSAHHPEDAASYLPPGAFLLVAWGFGIYAGSRDGSWEQFRWFFPCVALVTALGVTFWITYVSILDQELPIDQLWMLTLRKILVRLKVFLSTYFLLILGALFARALAQLAEEPRSDDDPPSQSESNHRFQAWLAFVGTIITALASLLGDLVT
jgi:hypothetical protein